jgi:alanine racemase
MTIRRAPAKLFFPILSTADSGERATRAEINLDAIAANVRALRHLAHSAQLMAVVKADGYGHGAVAVARTALESGASWLGVYTVGEGVRLRAAGAGAPILVFGPFQKAEAARIVEHRLTPSIWSYGAALDLNEAAHGRDVRFHLKVDTGLNRSGVAPSEAIPLLARVGTLPGLRAEGIFTHFACADDPSHPENARQLGVFVDTIDRLERAGHQFPIRHAANTAATLGLPESHFDMVRCGIGVYGYYPSEASPRSAPLTAALSLVTTVTRIHELPAGAGVGYDHEFICARATRIALAPIGYGDGLPRTLGLGKGRVIVGGALAPIVGRVSMDQITIDVTDAPGVRLGDDVILIGAARGVEHSAGNLAAAAGTISYDILTGIMPRVPRLYAKGGRLTAA